MKVIWKFTAIVGMLLANCTAAANPFDYFFGKPTLVQEWTYTATGDEDGEGGAEIVAFDETTGRVFITNGANDRIDVVDAADGSPIGEIAAANVNSVATYKGLVAIASAGDEADDLGSVILADAATLDIENTVTAGFLPDMLTFTPNGKYILVANEGEPDDDYVIDPEGSVTIIEVKNVGNAVAHQVDFTAFNSKIDALRAKGVRIFGPGATVAQDLEPEYIGVSADSKTAYVGLQENNAVAIVNIKKKKVVSINALGFKDHTQNENAFDASNEDGPGGAGSININTHPTKGMYQPDAISVISAFGLNFVLTANEGDARDYDGFSEEVRVKDLDLDPSVFTDPSLQDDENLGRLKTTTATGDADGDGKFEEIYSYGARSFSVFVFTKWGTTHQIYDSGRDFEDITAAELPSLFNSNDGDTDEFDQRSDDKGPEPESLAIGKDLGQTLSFIGLERTGGIMLYDVSNPFSPRFCEYTPGGNDVSPEGIDYISRDDSPFVEPAIVVSHEVSSTTTLYRIKRVGGVFSFLLND